MQSNTKTWMLVLGFGLLAVCLCAVVVIAAGGGIYAVANGWTPPWTTPSATQTVDEQMDLIQEQVQALRGIAATETVTRTLLTPDQLRQNVTTDFLEEYTWEEAQEDALILSAFGLLERNFDLFGFYEELYSEQISGYYDNEAKEMFVVQGSGFNGPERLTYAHEFNHALQDQAFDIRNGLHYNDEDCDDGSERCLGIQALLEGDSSLLELKWFESYATLADRQQVSEFYANLESPVYESSPAFMKEDFVFPYNQGYTFVEALYEKGGWQAVDQAYQQPPSSSEQVLHPELYPSEQPIEISLPDLSQVLGDGWQEIDRGVVGEWYTYLILAFGLTESSRLETEQAQVAAAGWGGDGYAVYTHLDGQQLAMAMVTAWDTPAEAQEFSQAFQKYASARFGPAQQASNWISAEGPHQLVLQDNYTAWLFAPDESTLESLRKNMPEPFKP